MICETDGLLENAQRVETSYGVEALALSVCCRYLDKLLCNENIRSCLADRHRDILDELQILAAASKSEVSAPPSR